jgi:hypothetical protein
LCLEGYRTSKKKQKIIVEFKIAVVSPLTSFALASIFAIAWVIPLQIAGKVAAQVPTEIGEQVGKTGATMALNTGEGIDMGFVISGS